MSYFRKELSVFVLAILGLGLSTSARSDDSQVEESLGNSQVLRMMDLHLLPRINKDLGFKSDDEKFAEKRQDVRYLLQEAYRYIGEKNYEKALQQLHKLDAIDGKTAEEIFIVHRTRVAIASASGDDTLLVQSLEAVVATNLATPVEQLQFFQALASLYYKQKNYPKTIAWATRYIGEGGADSEVRLRRTRAYYLNNEFAQAASELRAEIEAVEASGKKPTKAEMSLLTSAEFKSDNPTAFISAVEKSVTYYPSKEDWAELLNHVMSNPEFHEGLVLDVYRLMFHTAQFTTATDRVSGEVTKVDVTLTVVK